MLLGVVEASTDGLSDGMFVGRVLGAPDNPAVGIPVGSADGETVAIPEGILDGPTEGITLGHPDGCNDGVDVGASGFVLPDSGRQSIVVVKVVTDVIQLLGRSWREALQ